MTSANSSGLAQLKTKISKTLLSAVPPVRLSRTIGVAPGRLLQRHAMYAQRAGRRSVAKNLQHLIGAQGTLGPDRNRHLQAYQAISAGEEADILQ